MSMKNKIGFSRPRAAYRSRRANDSMVQKIIRAALTAFVGGSVICSLLLAAFALLLSSTTLPLTLVRPFACIAVSIGVAVSGFILASMMGRQLLMCGLACGVFFAVCQTTASFVVNGTNVLQNGNLPLLIAMLLSGILGGTLAAMKVPH